MGGCASVMTQRHHEPTYTQDVANAWAATARNHDPGDAVDDRDVNTNVSGGTSGFITRHSFDVAGEGGVYGCELFFLFYNLTPLLSPWRNITANLRLYFDSHSLSTDAPVDIYVGRLIRQIVQTEVTFNRARSEDRWPQAPSSFLNSRPWREQTGVDFNLIHHTASQVIVSVDRIGAPKTMSWTITPFVDAWRHPDRSIRAQNFGMVVYQQNARIAGGTGRINWGGDGYAANPITRYTYRYG